MFPDFLQPLLTLLSDHPYAFIFVGLLFAGELVLLPAIYLAVTGRLQLEYVFAVAVTAMALSDLVWYYLGRSVPRARLEQFAGGRIGRGMARVERLFLRRGPQILVGSKFIYGTRTAAQVLSGVHKMPLRTYVVANSIGVMLLVGALCGIGYSVRGAVGRMGEVMQHVEIAFLIFVLAAVLGHLVIARILRQRWSQ
ncbi:MAG: DedA family protein [Gammaproteobacteria bacterium]